jgi:hypothetical protein
MSSTKDRIDRLPPNKIQRLLLNIHNNISYIYNTWLTRNESKTFLYIMNIQIMFNIYGISMFEKDPSNHNIITGTYLYSLKIENSKIRTPKNLDIQQKELYKKHVENLIEKWNELGKHFSYDKLCNEICKDENNKKELTKCFDHIKF